MHTIAVITRRLIAGEEDILLLPEFPPDQYAISFETARAYCQSYTHAGGYQSREYNRVLRLSKAIPPDEAETLPLVAEFRALGNSIRLVTACSNKSYLTRIALAGFDPKKRGPQ